jgi:hypothetical protein
VSSAIEKQEEMTAQRLEPELCFHYCREPIKAFARIHRLRGDIDLHAWG